MDQGGPDYMVEFPHGYTYSAHPVACAAGLAALDVLEREQLPQRVKAMSGYFEQAVHQLKERLTSRTFELRICSGYQSATLSRRAPAPPFELGLKCFEKGFYVRWGGDTVQLAPAL